MANTLEKFNEMLNSLKEEKKKEKIRLEQERQDLIVNMGREMTQMIKPAMEMLTEQARINKEELKQALKELTINTPEVNVPPIEVPEIKVPTPQVSVNVPPLDIKALAARIEIPKEMDIKGWVRLQGVDLNNPLPVQLRDAKGNPVKLFENLTTLISQGGGGGKHNYFTIKGFSQSAYSELINADGRLRVSVETGGSGLTDSELRAAHLDVQQLSGSIDSVYATGAFGSTAVDGVWNSDNRLRVSVETGGSGLTDAELRASSVPIAQVSGAKWSTEATIVGTATVQATALDIRSLLNATDSVSAYQVSGHNWSVYATGFGASVGATLLNGDGNSLDARDRNWTITETVAVSGSLDTVKASGIARQTNPTAVSDGDNQRIATDDLGRTLTRPIQVRDLIVTAYASLTNGTETTLVSAVAGSYLDLIYIMGANNSNAAVTVDIRPITAGNIVMTLQIPASGTAGIACPVPLPQSDTGNNWTADMADITGTVVYLTALFSKEI